MRTMHIHPVFRKVFDEISLLPSDTDNNKRGTVWFTQTKPVTLRPGGVARLTGAAKFQGAPSTQTILVDSPDDPANLSRFPDELLVRPDLQPSTGLMAKKITVLVRNMSAREITLTRGMPIAHLFPVNVVSSPPEKKESDVEPPGKLTPSSFNFGDSSVPKEWKERLVTKMMERSEVFSLHEFDVGCSKKPGMQTARFSAAAAFFTAAWVTCVNRVDRMSFFGGGRV